MSQNPYDRPYVGGEPSSTERYPVTPEQVTGQGSTAPSEDYFAADAPAYPAQDEAFSSTGASQSDPYYPAPVTEPTFGGGDQGASSTKDAALDEAANVKDTAVESGQQVAAVAKDEAKNVVAETGAQAKNLLSQAAGEASSQVNTQQNRLAGVVQGYAKELGSMSSAEESSGPLTDLASQASQKAGEFGQWLENHEPKEVLNEVTAFARRRPVAFLLGAGLLGVVAGRLTKNLAADAKSSTPEPVTTSGPEWSAPSAPRSLTDSVPTQDDNVYGEPAYTDTVYADAAPAYDNTTTYGSGPAFTEPRGDVAR